MPKVLVTGVAGFIGSFLAIRLLNEGYEVIGIDNLNTYYDVNLKKDRLENIKKSIPEVSKFTFKKIDLIDKGAIDKLFDDEKFDYVINLAAQAGVRYSIENPYAYIDSNIIGFINILEACRKNPVKHLLYASSSSVYGGNKKIPFSVNDSVDHPVSLYAATKKSNELMAHSYSNLYQIPSTGLRFFTVYGPFGRPDMAYFSFAKKIINSETIEIFNNGDMERDFTYIDDIVESIYRLLKEIPRSNKEWNEEDNINESYAPYRILNIGNNQPVKLIDFVEILEEKLGVKGRKTFLPMQPGDVKQTFADISELENLIDFKPKFSIQEGLENFCIWYKERYVE
ncbi:NAD-dependent epimerase [Vagococcus fluvialis]|uniref:NAD-dependent epimerase n=1 Tax=Vagococcus fluvialis TaxID=2738 RepID=UPI003B210407